MFYLFANPAEMAYLSVRDGKLSNAVRLVEFRRRKVAVHTFWGGPKPGFSDSLRAEIIESHNFFFVLMSYPGEIAYLNSPNRELSNGARVMELYRNRNVNPSRSPCFKAIDRKSAVIF